MIVITGTSFQGAWASRPWKGGGHPIDIMTLADTHRLLVIRLVFHHRHLWEWTTLAEKRWTHDGRKLTPDPHYPRNNTSG